MAIPHALGLARHFDGDFAAETFAFVLVGHVRTPWFRSERRLTVIAADKHRCAAGSIPSEVIALERRHFGAVGDKRMYA